MSKTAKFISSSMKLFIQIVILSILSLALVFGYYHSQKTNYSINMSDNFQNVYNRSKDSLYNNYSLLKAVIYDLEHTPDFEDSTLFNIFKEYVFRNTQIYKMTLSGVDGNIIYVLDDHGSNVTYKYKGLPIEAPLSKIANNIPRSDLEVEMKTSIYSENKVDILYPIYKNAELSGFFSITIDANEIFSGIAFRNLLKKNRILIANTDGSIIFESKDFSGKHAYVYNMNIEDIRWLVQIESKEDMMGIILKRTIGLAFGLFFVLGFLLHLETQLWNKGNYIEELKKLKKKIENIAYTDSLTGLCNRLSITNQISNYIYYSKKEDKCAVIFLDLDNFKNVNDVFGHDKGDQLLKSLSDIFKKMSYRDNRVVASRLGGDEFVILFKDIQSENEVHNFCNDLLNNINMISSVSSGEINVSASIGVSFFPYSGMDVKTLFKNSDMAMYNSKNMGKNQYSLFTDFMGEKIKRKVLIESKLRTFASNKDFSSFSLEYQPQVQISKNPNFRNAEALIRWNDNELGSVSPFEFIEIAETTGTINELGFWILRETCKYLNLLKSKFGSDQNISINISPEQLKAVDFIDRTKHIIEEESISPSQITMEITEQVFINDMIDCIKILSELKNIGFKLSLDDFGTGYSSLSYLSRLPIDILKIDKSFVDNIESDANSLALIEGIFHLSQALNLKVIVEGVETEGQFKLLKEKGIETIQGYYFSKSLTPEKYIAFSESRLIIE